MENNSISQGEGKDPSSFLSDIIGNSVIVKLNSGVVYKGELMLCRGGGRLEMSGTLW
nr:U4/U6-U5 snRNP complex subunit lsm6 [Trichoderma atroviride]